MRRRVLQFAVQFFVLIKNNISKPVVAYVAGQTAPPGKTMGHAGAVISGKSGTAEYKQKALVAAGVKVAVLPSQVVGLLGYSKNTVPDG